MDSPAQRQDSTVRLPQFRVTVNSRCGRACFFCRPSGEAVATGAGQELSVQDLLAVAVPLLAHGIDSIKLTGGDPALWEPLEEAVTRLREAGFAEIELISRHPRIGERAAALARAGVTQFNMSVDTLDPALHRQICGVDDLAAVLGALTQVVATGVPVKVNTVVMAGVNDGEIEELAAWCEKTGVATLKLLDVIRDMDSGAESFARRLAITRGGASIGSLYVPLHEVAAALREQAASVDVRSQGGLGHPMTVLRLASGFEVVLKDSRAGAWYGDVCTGCRFYPCHDALMALRLTADRRLQFCLLREEISVPLGEILHDPDQMDSVLGRALSTYATARFRPAGPDDEPARPVRLLPVVAS
ncbi:radical SAM protein [Nocardia miyunensis]|uniref:radical SAM protein n=1 Tax=Nocardia miyunensis TaxID=282684 RepID=UPI002481551A|nr:radical SAM protein [Nocardia miyunensis]